MSCLSCSQTDQENWTSLRNFKDQQHAQNFLAGNCACCLQLRSLCPQNSLMCSLDFIRKPCIPLSEMSPSLVLARSSALVGSDPAGACKVKGIHWLSWQWKHSPVFMTYKYTHSGSGHCDVESWLRNRRNTKTHRGKEKNSTAKYVVIHYNWCNLLA